MMNSREPIHKRHNDAVSCYNVCIEILKLQCLMNAKSALFALALMCDIQMSGMGLSRVYHLEMLNISLSSMVKPFCFHSFNKLDA